MQALLAILGSALSIWESKEKTKYIDKKIAIEKELYDELAKPREKRSNAVLDGCEFELRQLAFAVAAAIGKYKTRYLRAR